MRESLTKFIETEIIPRYDAFDRGHQRDHILAVIEQGMYLSRFYDVNPEIIYVACACHDLGIREGREFHHLASGRIIREELDLSQWFSPEEIETIAEAAEDHRASSDREPRTIYGKIVAEADRQIVPETVIRRTVQYGLEHYPDLDREGQWERTVEHLGRKYAEGGYLKLWIPESPNAARIAALRDIIADKDRLRPMFEVFYKEERYKMLLPQAKSLLDGETDDVAAMANLSSLLHHIMEFWWTGFYRVMGEELVLGPFQGPVACTRIPYGKGVCGTAWKKGETVIVPDVEQFPGHIACSSRSKSEIVVPVRRGGRVIAVLDIDSDRLGAFDGTDGRYLEAVVELFCPQHTEKEIEQDEHTA